MTTPDDQTDRRRRTNKMILIATGSALAVIALIVIVGAIAGGDQTDTADAPATTTAVVAPSTATVPVVPDPRCAPAAEDIVAMVAAGLTVDGQTLTNATVINDAGTTYFGATIVDTAGEMESRSDVWILRGGGVFAATGGARNSSSYPKASDIGVSSADPAIAAVDACVVELTR
ncbi:hypothetical protein IU448_15315 [Nocardia flavorosea]|uniref:hypothetical protein n=1 Tax=Nocardia flavorosea TaxID=53429 RepID=UPI00189509A1|nr:hypothetical protein [Nocardia flavorosea]MBF6350375.1 hypothetical protein [Nocardia flavorosea]